MKKDLFKKLTALLICLTILVPVMSLDVFAEESGAASSALESIDEEDIWKALTPAYMSTGFKSINDRIKGNELISPMVCMLVKDGYALYVDSLTAEVVILQLTEPNDDGEYELDADGIYKYIGYFSTNPYNIGSSQSSTGTKTTDSIKSKLYSQVIVDYSENDTSASFESFVDAAKNDQIVIKAIRSGIRIEYTLGREEIEYLVPRLIRSEKLEELRDQILANSPVARDNRQFMAFYQLKDPSDTNLTKKTVVEMLNTYPISEKFPVYVCEPHITPKELMRLEKMVKLYTNYSFEQLDTDHAETDYTSNDKAPPLFKLALEYTIDEMGLSVRCNAGNIRFDSSSYKLSNVTLLPYAGSGNVNNSGYVFTPDGSGALINFENIKGVGFKTTNSLYGQDYAFHKILGANKELMRLPVFGVVEIVKDQYSTIEEITVVDEETGEETTSLETVMHDLKIGYLAVIESGDSLANITVDNGGALHMFTSVYTSFNPRPKDSYVLSGGISATSSTEAMWTVESKRKYTGDYKLRYFILSDDISYSGMANVYRDYLIKQGVLTELEITTEDIPLYIETLGALEVMKRVLGIPVTKTISMTSFDDTIDILNLLKDNGISNVNVKLKGWANDGMISRVPNGVDIVDVLGGDEGFYKLLDYASKNEVTIYPDFEFAYAMTKKAFDGFNPSKDMTKTIDERPAGQKVYDPLFQGYNYSRLGIISPNAMSRFYTNTYNEYKKYNVGAISVASLGDSLSSDFNTKDTLHREDSKKLVTKLLDQIQKDNGKVMVSGGNAYTLKYATDILDIPLDDSRYKYSSATIPFMGMVLHGYKEYAGTAINLAGDYRYTLLKSIENGASPYFVIAYENTSELKQYYYQPFEKYYSVRYNIWVKDMIDTYHRLNNAFKDLKQCPIVSHMFLDNQNKVVKVTYENGTYFLINYLLKDYTVTIGNETFTIPAEDFIKVDINGKIG
ncbi:MAG: hypothetical protein CVU97_00875 [Firmicutes bacterium HGW-Firmicutes-21]|nr:MAG: hypothetical protein CVU97_00875 [Firmicutes bacterium HGW-Firmicutes-21]